MMKFSPPPTFKRREDTVGNIAKTQSEIETYLNAGKSLQRWEYFMKCMTVTPSSFTPMEMASDMIRFDLDKNKVLFKLAIRHGLKNFTLASLNIYNQNRNFMSQYFVLKPLPRG
ncbi:MAG: hypothetical protein KGH71_00105 [Candidatus Micrarchaeota archaeon]|nr:hypothetical protein [Candidatus Micrarchaeota archaeon]